MAHTHTHSEESLFFTQTVPQAVPQAVYDSTTYLTEVCPVPDIPAATVSIVSGEGFSFCQVETERGTFRSRSITTLPGEQLHMCTSTCVCVCGSMFSLCVSCLISDPSFLYEPQDVTASPINNMTSAAFSCAVSPTFNLEEIEWGFQMTVFDYYFNGSGCSGCGYSEVLRTDPASGVTVVSGLSDPGTSILLLDSVGNQYEGFYCMV